MAVYRVGRPARGGRMRSARRADKNNNVWYFPPTRLGILWQICVGGCVCSCAVTGPCGGLKLGGGGGGQHHFGIATLLEEWSGTL